jgi:hypothetical protein
MQRHGARHLAVAVVMAVGNGSSNGSGMVPDSGEQEYTVLY